MDKEIIKYKNIASVISIVMLLVAIADLPYGYYTLLRLVITASAIFLVWTASELKKTFWLVLMGIVAILFNPIIPVHLTKEIWVVIDVIVAVLFLVSIFRIKNYAKQNGN